MRTGNEASGVSPRRKITARRRQTIDAAAAVFASHGYRGASTRTLAEMLGIKAGSLYSHFTSKDDALEQVCRIGIERQLDCVIDAVAGSPTLDGRVRRYFQHLNDAPAVHRHYVAVYMNERRHLAKDALERLAMLEAEFRLQWHDVFQTAEDRGELHPSMTPRFAEMLLVGHIRHLNQVGQDNTPLFGDYLQASVEAFLRGVARPATQ